MTDTSLTISVLSLVVAGLAVFVARANLQRQLQVTARETWMREFREQSALILARMQALRGLVGSPPSKVEEKNLQRGIEIIDALIPAFYTVLLLIFERETEQYPDLTRMLTDLLNAARNGNVLRHDRDDPEALNTTIRGFTLEASYVLKRERAAIEALGRWRAPPSLLQLKDWLGRGPPRWPT